MLSLVSNGQTGAYWNNPQLTQSAERVVMSDDIGDHLSVRPLRIKYLPHSIWQADTTAHLFRGMGLQMWQPPADGKWKVGVMPVLDFMGGYETGYHHGALYRVQPGVATHIRYGDKWSFYLDALAGAERPPAYISEFISERGVFPGMGRNLSDAGDPSHFTPTARASYSPSPYFEFELGYGKNFFGYGRQSLSLGDVAANYPYLKIVTDVWHLQYVNLFSAPEDIRIDPDDRSTYRRKYTATHYLSWAISPRWNVGIFESIIWQGRDTLSDRGFDPNYLNPIIFLRPVEYAVGSPDNALMGLDLAFKASPKILLYGQVVIDEFLLSEFRDNRGWWANKWGGQIGAKTFDWPMQGLNLQVEFNSVRPFTYTHGSPIQSFTHFNEPLAHRLATNFHEASVYGYYEKDDFYGSARWTIARYGRDPDSLNLGGDIFRSYIGPARIYGNHTTQGITSTLFFQELEAGYILNRNINLRLALRYTYRRLHTPAYPIYHIAGPVTQNSHFFTLSFATALYREDRGF